MKRFKDHQFFLQTKTHLIKVRRLRVMKRGTCGRKWGWNGHILKTNILINAHLIEEKTAFWMLLTQSSQGLLLLKDETTIKIWISPCGSKRYILLSRSLLDISPVSCSYRVSGSAGCHLVCSLSPQGLFRLKDPLKRMSCPQTEHSQRHMNRPWLVRLGCIRADISFPRSERAEMSSSTLYLKWHMRSSHFPISVNLIRGRYANEMTAPWIHVEYCVIM